MTERKAMIINGALLAMAVPMALYHNPKEFLLSCTAFVFLEACGRLA